MEDLLSINQACDFVRTFFSRNVTPSNISYLVQYGRVRKFGNNGSTQVVKKDLMDYYNSTNVRSREKYWKDKLGHDLNWALSFEQFKEYETTKHVHRLHPYKGKFIPQLVEYFLDNHTDNFKKEGYFKKGDILLDPFCGSGTTLIQANELGMHAVGIDISAFNALISNIKIGKYDFDNLRDELHKITKALKQFIADSKTITFESKLIEELATFNNKYFPVPGYKYKVKRNEINEDEYGDKKEKEFLPIYQKLIDQYGIQLKQERTNSFLDRWYLQP